ESFRRSWTKRSKPLSTIQLPPNLRDLPPDRALVGRMLVYPLLEPVPHFPDKFGLGLWNSMFVDSTRERRVESIPVMPRRHAWAAAPAPCRFGRAVAIEEAELPFEALDLGALHQHVRSRDRHALGGLHDTAEILFSRLHAADRNSRTRRA